MALVAMIMGALYVCLAVFTARWRPDRPVGVLHLVVSGVAVLAGRTRWWSSWRARVTPAAQSVITSEDAEAWHGWSATKSEAGPFVLPLAPDRLHKGNVSGGPPYGVVLPDGCADGLFVAETTMAFVSYLNWVFSNGGFPGPTDSESQWRVKAALAQDLLPL